MAIRILIASALTAVALALAGCTNTQPAYYGTYPSDYEFGPNHGYEPYASAPYDPYGAYYQNFAPATPYYYEPPESHRNCDERPCIAYRRDAGKQPVPPQVAAPTPPKPGSNSPSTISRPSQAGSSTGAHPQPPNID